MRKLKSELKSEQKISLTIALREALTVLEMPLVEFAEWVQKQIEHNPALESQDEELVSLWEEEKPPGFEILDKLDSSFQSTLFPETPSNEPSWIDQIAAPPPTLRCHLMAQARETLLHPDKLQQMEELIDSLDERGFLTTVCADIDLARLLQSFDPPGIGAQSLQQCLLLQLELRDEKNLLAYRLIQDYYEDLLQNRLDLLSQKLGCSLELLQSVVRDSLAPLNLNPAALFHPSSVPAQIPDIFVEPSDNGWLIRLNDTFIPKFQVSCLPELHRYQPSARWVETIVSRRGAIMTRIVRLIFEVQADFFQGKSSLLNPLSLREAAHRLTLHESTISRAVKEKYVSCPQGIFPLRYFFPHASSDSEISHLTAKERLKELINRENKRKPLSDQKLAAALQSQGIPCARRTVTKYRQNLLIPPASERKKNSLI